MKGVSVLVLCNNHLMLPFFEYEGPHMLTPMSMTIVPGIAPTVVAVHFFIASNQINHIAAAGEWTISPMLWTKNCCLSPYAILAKKNNIRLTCFCQQVFNSFLFSDHDPLAIVCPLATSRHETIGIWWSDATSQQIGADILVTWRRIVLQAESVRSLKQKSKPLASVSIPTSWYCVLYCRFVCHYGYIYILYIVMVSCFWSIVYGFVYVVYVYSLFC